MRSIVLQGYEDAAPGLIDRFEAISSAAMLAPVLRFLPAQRCRVLDVGAGTGRDAAWLAQRGHDVVAVEPVAALRNAGMARHSAARISWLDDTLPALARTKALGRRFDLILLSAVWHHLGEEEREHAFPTLRGLVTEHGRLVMSLRNGPGSKGRPVYPAPPAETRALAERNGFSVLAEASTPSIQAENRKNGVTWTWLVLEAREPA